MAGIFPRLLSILDYDTEMFSGEKIKLFALVIEAMTACLSSCSSSKSAFEAFIGYNRLVKMILNKVPPCEEVNKCCCCCCLFILWIYSIISLVEHQGTIDISSSYPKFVLTSVNLYY